MSVIYRDTVSKDRILIPMDDPDEWESWDITCIEVWNGEYMRCREVHIPGIILQRHYKKEEL